MAEWGPALCFGCCLDSGHIWSCNWPSIWPTRTQHKWQHEFGLLSEHPAEFQLTWLDFPHILCQEIFLILISSVTKVDHAVLSKTQIMAELQCSLGKWKNWHGILIHHNKYWGYYSRTVLLIFQKSPWSCFASHRITLIYLPSFQFRPISSWHSPLFEVSLSSVSPLPTVRPWKLWRWETHQQCCDVLTGILKQTGEQENFLVCRHCCCV